MNFVIRIIVLIIYIVFKFVETSAEELELLDETDIDWDTFSDRLQDQEETDVDLGEQIRQQGEYKHASVYIYSYAIKMILERRDYKFCIKQVRKQFARTNWAMQDAKINGRKENVRKVDGSKRFARQPVEAAVETSGRIVGG